MYFFLIAAFIFAALEALALQKSWFRLEVFAKPGVMIALFFWLFTSVGLNGSLIWFGAGVLLSLAGDVLLMISLDRLFLAGLVAFLLAHVTYIVGFNLPLPALTAWGVILAVLIGWGGARVIRRILSEAMKKGQSRMRIPIIIYSTVISLMLLSAMMKLADLSWDAGASLLVSLGAFLFYLSDVILAWIKFVNPIKNGRIYNIAAYHLGQIALIAGVIIQYKT
ncbi:MAG: lysoplasmalogenase [Anaerolineales bacterium]|nr:lysoplasmalogenase [Anaerolineales bacterium]